MFESNLESAIEEFEAALRSNSNVDIRDFASTKTEEVDFQFVTELIRVEMELSWDAGQPRTVDDYIRLFPEIVQNAESLDRIAFEEYRMRVASGEGIRPSDYQAKYGVKPYHWPVLKATGPQSETWPNDSALFVCREQSTDFDPSDTTHPDLAGRILSGQLVSTPTVESTLHKRLRFIGLTILVTLMYFLFLAWQNPVGKVGLFLESAWLHWLNGICLFVCLCICVFLWGRRRIPITTLRILELVLFGSILTELSCGLVSDLFMDHELDSIITGPHELFHYSSSWSLPFFAIIVAYGTLVPSSWRRCTIIVSIMAVIPVVICTCAAVAQFGISQIFFYSFLLQMLIWMATAAAIAVYGVRRLEESQYQLLRSGKLGKYRLIRQIAVGGMGEVFQAEDTLLHRRCAIKIMHPVWTSHPHLLTRFEREVQVLAGISHRNVVQIYDLGFTNDRVFYYVMEYLDGKNLEQVVNEQGALPTKMVIDVFAQVADALDVIHRGGIVHRDVKPSNIFLANVNEKELAKLLDFGLIKSFSDIESDQQITLEGAIIGTPAYMSPEQATGVGVDQRTDLYSLGAVVYFMITGTRLFERPTSVEALTAHINCQPRPFPETEDPVARELQEIVIRCLAKDPDCRFQTAGELLTALQNIGALKNSH